MKRIKLPQLTLALTALSLIFSGIAAIPVGAETANAGAAQGVEVSPTLVELNAARGNTYNIKIKLNNVTAADLVYNVSIDDFGAADETGSPKIIADSKLPATASIKTWVTTVPKFALASRQSTTINAQVTIPNNAEPGGHYGVFRFSGTAPEVDSTGVGLSASAGVLMLIRVDGAITEKANIASFYSAKNDRQGFFFENGPITFVTRVKNDGNIHIKPTGSIELRDTFGGLVKTMPVNADKSNVLPNSIRRFETTYDSTWMIGRYTANEILGYGTTGQALTNTISFWVIPYRLILIVLLILVTIGFIFKRLIKSYNNHIIEKSKNGHTQKKKD